MRTDQIVFMQFNLILIKCLIKTHILGFHKNTREIIFSSQFINFRLITRTELRNATLNKPP